MPIGYVFSQYCIEIILDKIHVSRYVTSESTNALLRTCQKLE